MNSGSTEPLLPLHANPDPQCPVGCRVHTVLGEAFATAERALEDALSNKTLAELLDSVTGPAGTTTLPAIADTLLTCKQESMPNRS